MDHSHWIVCEATGVEDHQVALVARLIVHIADHISIFFRTAARPRHKARLTWIAAGAVAMDGRSLCAYVILDDPTEGVGLVVSDRALLCHNRIPEAVSLATHTHIRLGKFDNLVTQRTVAHDVGAKVECETMQGRRKEFATLLCISATNEERAAPDVVDVDRITFLKSVHEMVDKERICIEPPYGGGRGCTLQHTNPCS